METHRDEVYLEPCGSRCEMNTEGHHHFQLKNILYKKGYERESQPAFPTCILASIELLTGSTEIDHN